MVSITEKLQSMNNRQEQKRCVIGIRGQTPDPDYPVDIWFDSLKSIANVLSDENQKLLKVIEECQPQSVTELAELSGRAVSNLSRTLKCLEKHQLIYLQRMGSCQKIMCRRKNSFYLVYMEY